MIRAFLALPLPDGIRAALRVEQFLLPLPRAVDPASLHLTLAFLGEVPEAVLEALDEEMQRLSTPGFALTLAGIGHFGGTRPRAVWAGVLPSPPLTALQAKVAQIARRAGAAIERRRFVPHVTLGRFPPPEPDQVMRLERAIVDRAGFRAGPFHADRVTLFRSHLGPKGARYEDLADYPLT